MSYPNQYPGQNPNMYDPQWSGATSSTQWQSTGVYSEDPQVAQYLSQQPAASTLSNSAAHRQQAAMYGNGYIQAPPTSNSTSVNPHYQPPSARQQPTADSLDLHPTAMDPRAYPSYGLANVSQSQSQSDLLSRRQVGPGAGSYRGAAQPLRGSAYGTYAHDPTLATRPVVDPRLQTGIAISAGIQAAPVPPTGYTSRELPQENLSHIFASPATSPGSLDNWNQSPMASPPVTSPRSETTSVSVSPTIPTTLPHQGGRKPSRPGPKTTTSGTRGKKLKRARTGTESDLDDGDEGESIKDGVAKGGAASHRACAHCKKAKIKCTFPENENTCHRCKAHNRQCTIEKRKPPRNPNKREYFMQQLKEKDAIIESLLKELYNPYTATPLSVRSVRESTSGTDERNENVAAWLGRVQDGAQVPSGQGFEFGDGDGADDDGEEVSDGGEGSVGTARESPLEEAYPIAQLRELRISQDEGKERDRASEGSATETLAEDPNGTVKDDVGIVNKDYFKAGPSVDVSQRMKLGQEHTKSNLITHGLVTGEDVDKLFEIYHSSINAFVPLLDPVLHTPKETFARCPCLFTVICAITSRYYPEKAEIYPIAMHFALNECANALMHGWKCIELAQAFMLLTMYAHPAKRWEEERSYLYGGLAMRIAIDLNVHIAPISRPKNEKEEREHLNRTRLWMICFQTDWQMAAHYGKPSSLRENRIIRSVGNLYLKSECSLVADIHLCAYNELLRHIAGFHSEVYSDQDSRTGLNKNMNFGVLIDKYDGQLSNLLTEWKSKFSEFKRFQSNPVYLFRCKLLPYVVGYTRLIWYSFSFQQAFDRGMQESDKPLLTKCMEAAMTVVRTMIEELAPAGIMRFAPNGWFNFCSFSSAFLMKLLRPDFSSMLSKQDEEAIFSLITRLIDTMSSEKIAIDDKHTPKLWSRFLQELITKHRKDGAMATIPRSERRVTFSQNQVFEGAQTAPQPAQAMPVVQQPFAVEPMTAQNMPYGAWPGPQDPAMLGALGFNPNVTMNVGPGLIQPTDAGGQMMVDDDGMLATMAALNHPGFWDNMMLPGFPWPDSPLSVAELPTLEGTAQPVQPAQPPVGNTWY